MYQQVESEQAIISLLVHQPNLYHDVGLQVSDFTNSTCARVYEQIGKMLVAGQAVDLITLSASIPGTNSEFLLQVVRDDILPEALPQYIDAVRRARVRNDLEKAAIQIQVIARANDDVPTADLVQNARSKLDAIQTGEAVHVVSMSEAIDEWLPELESMFDNPRETWGLPLGLDIDSVTGGLVMGEMTLVMGKPGSGKSSLAMQSAVYTAVRHHNPALIFSMEMSRKQYMTRLACGLAEVDSRLLKLGKIERNSINARKLLDAAASLKAAPLFVVDELQTVATIDQTLYKFKRDHGIVFAVVDYLDMIQDSKKTEMERVPFITRSIKRSARKHDLAVWLLHALSRSPEVSAQSAKYGGDYDADAVLILAFDPYRTDDTAEIAVAKNRNGATERVRMLFNAGTTTWRNPARGTV